MQQQYRLRAGVALDEARHRDAGAEPEIPDFGFHSLRVRGGQPPDGYALPAMTLIRPPSFITQSWLELRRPSDP